MLKILKLGEFEGFWDINGLVVGSVLLQFQSTGDLSFTYQY